MTPRLRIAVLASILTMAVVAVVHGDTWKTLASFSGKGTEDTAAFTTHGGDLRFEFTVQPNSSGPVPLLLKMYPKGAPADAHSLIRLQCTDCNGLQTKDAGKVPAGTYYLRVTTSRPWTLKVEERP